MEVKKKFPFLREISQSGKGFGTKNPTLPWAGLKTNSPPFFKGGVRGRCCPKIYLSTVNGFIFPFGERTSKCKCVPVERPVDPITPIFCP